ncbi:MAG: hypothetical protein E6K18_06835 [Methanobacteriota archaeon]|nr:MAG: hypothetical protein E6K18_06835 [Euryarchaeota archaeon]
MKSFAVAALAIVVLGSILAVPRAGAAPPQPYNLYGIARDASAAALPQNTAIRGFIDGVDYSNGTVVYDGLGHYDMDTYGNWMTGTTSDTPEVKEGGNLGDPIMITSGDMTTAGSVFTVSKLWTPGDVITQNLGLAAAASQPALLKIESITTQPADGLTKYVYLCNPTANPVDATAYYLERDAVGSFTGPTHAIPGPATIPSGLTLYVNLTTWIGSDLTNTGDVLKLVWSNGPGSAFSGQPVVVDRVEYNATGGSGTLFWEPGNTLMSDALAPGVGQEIRRDVGCGDTNNNSVDFTLGFERGRPVTGNLPPTVTVVAPNGGEDWTGNTNHVIQWTQSDDRDSSLTDTLYYSTTGPAGPWTIITSGSFANSPNPFFTWTVPCVDSSNAYVRVFALDANSGAGQDLSDAAFTIDCTRPSLTATVPPNGQNNVGVNTNIVLTFSEAMSTAATAGAVNVGPAIGGRVDSWNGPTNTILTITHAAFSGATMYTVTVSCAALDVSNPGNQLAGCTRTFTFNTTNANAAPSVALASPAGGEDWSGGSSHTVTYTLTDPDSNPLTVDIEWSSNGGGSWNAVQMGLSQAPSATPYNYAWTVPSVDTVQAQVRVCANDGVNPRVCAPSPNFRIDATRPRAPRDPHLQRDDGTYPDGGRNHLPALCQWPRLHVVDDHRHR